MPVRQPWDNTELLLAATAQKEEVATQCELGARKCEPVWCERLAERKSVKAHALS